MNKRIYKDVTTGNNIYFEGEPSILESKLITQGLIVEEIPNTEEILNKLKRGDLTKKDFLKIKLVTSLIILSKYLNSNYDTHISNSDNLWVFDPIRADIVRVMPEQRVQIVKNKAYHYTPMFRSERDARFAYKAVKDILDKLYE